jgi:hypothetical protein
MSRGGLALVAPLLRTPRYEVLPTPSAEESVLEWVPRELTITVTASPARGLEPTLALTERLCACGYRTVPHLSARLVRDGGHLADIVSRLTAAWGRRRVRPGYCRWQLAGAPSRIRTYAHGSGGRCSIP